MTARTLDDAVRNLTANKSGHEAATADWSTKFSANPAYALQWGDTMFERAATLELCNQVLAFLTGEVNPGYEGDRVECVVKEFERDILRMASRVESSTSQCSNLMENHRRKAKAEMLEWLRGERGFF